MKEITDPAAPQNFPPGKISAETLGTLSLLLEMALKSISLRKLSVLNDLKKNDNFEYCSVGKYIQINDESENDPIAFIFEFVFLKENGKITEPFLFQIDFDKTICPEEHWEKLTNLAGTAGEYYKEIEWQFLHYLNDNFPIFLRDEYKMQLCNEEVDFDTRKEILIKFINEILERMYMFPPLPPSEGPVFFDELPKPLTYYAPILDEAIEAVHSKQLSIFHDHNEMNTHTSRKTIERYAAIHNDNGEEGTTVFNIYFAGEEDGKCVSGVHLEFHIEGCTAKHWQQIKKLDGDFSGKYCSDFYLGYLGIEANFYRASFYLWKEYERHFYAKSASKKFLKEILTGFIDEVVSCL